MTTTKTMCTIEHHATLFAFLSKYAITQAGEQGKAAILEGMTRYGNERGRRMAANATSNGDPLTTMTNQAYGEWKPDYEGQMDFGQLRIAPTLQTYIAKCAWCDAWHKHGLIDYGKYYCINIDKAVYQGFNPDFVCTPIKDVMSWGGTRCEFDWGHPLSEEEGMELSKKKRELGTRFIKDFNFHTAHLYATITHTLKEYLGDISEEIINQATKDYIALFGVEYFDILKGKYPG